MIDEAQPTLTAGSARGFRARLAPWLVPGIPFLLSLGLSLSTVGSHVFWQDSGFYLVAVKEMGVLYPPGFMLYLILCKAWTILFSFLDFTLAVHLFSSFCAALAGGALAVAGRDLLRARGVFRVVGTDPGGTLAGWAGAGAGCLAACGYTFWSTAIYAKGYALYFLVLALLLGRMIRASENGKPRDFMVVAALIGLAWAAHPSAALIGPALLLFLWAHRGMLNVKRVIRGVATAAACALGPSLLLPALAADKTRFAMGDPAGFGKMLSYLAGRVYVGREGAFSLDAQRLSDFSLFFWEEFLGVSIVLLSIGLIQLCRRNPRAAAGLALWSIPYLGVTILFSIEGQHDCWFVAAWLPLSGVIAIGLCTLAALVQRLPRTIVGAVVVVGVAWASFLNHSHLNQRGYVLAEHYGRILLENLDPGAILLCFGDDSLGTTQYLQRVRNVRTDVLVVYPSYLIGSGRESRSWYADRLRARFPEVDVPDIPLLPGDRYSQVIERSSTAFINANAMKGRPMFTSIKPLPENLGKGLAAVPAGALWKVAKVSESSTLESRYWRFPIDPEQVVPLYRRKRGKILTGSEDGLKGRSEAYEERLVRLLLNARKNLAVALFDRGQFQASARLLESVLALNPQERREPANLALLAESYQKSGRQEKALSLYQAIVEMKADPFLHWKAHTHLGEILGALGRDQEAAAHRHRARAIMDSDPSVRRMLGPKSPE